MKIYSGPRQFLNEGYVELIQGYDNCLLTQTIFSASTLIGDCLNSTTFYTGTTLQDYPLDSLWYSTITSLIESCPQIGPGNVDINPLTNEITISTNCEPESLHNSKVLIKMQINYDIECVCLNVTPTRTPTQTPTPTRTPTQTPTMTKTPTQTPTKTPTQTPTTSHTPTPTSTFGSTPPVTPTMTKTPTQTPTQTPTMTKTPTQTPTQTPTMTKTPTQTPTQTPTMTMTPTQTMTMTPTASYKIMYFAYLICGERPDKTTVVIQPVPAVPGNVVGGVILDFTNKLCWELMEINSDLSQLENNWGGVTYYYNWFDDVSPTINTGTVSLRPCEQCNKVLEAISVPVRTKCPTNLRNWSDCARSDASGLIGINDVLVYSFDSTFDANVFIRGLDTYVGDVVKIILTPNVTNSVVTLNVTYNGASLFSQTSSTSEISFVYTVRCDVKSTTQYNIDIFSTCKEGEPSITLYSNSYTEGGVISTSYYSTFCAQENNSPDMVWILNSLDVSNIVSYEILCEDIDASGSSPDGYFIHWYVTDIDPNQLNIPSDGNWTSGNVQPTDYGSGDNANGWNGPCPPSNPEHNYRIKISATLLSGNVIDSNYSTFTAGCISPFC